ncbi:hypothetical protein B0H14DRAFT_2674824 [Mycena olivaceomarginata]|nr:hypothetical protein B0H14DRAFT_2674824 [Mycena olivaceomarginata]
MSLLGVMFSCCLRPRVDDDPTVMPTETTTLISHHSGHSSTGFVDTTAMNRQRLHDRMLTIVRAKEGKMVNVNLRAPFILGTAPPSPPSQSPSSPALPVTSDSAPPSPSAPAPNGNHAHIPHILTMTPARMRLRAGSGYSSPSGSRSSSRRRIDSADRSPVPSHLQLHPAPERPPRGPNPSSDWFGDTDAATESESDSHASRLGDAVAIAIRSPVRKDEDMVNAGNGIAFSWGDT